jgi:hypothetical protein
MSDEIEKTPVEKAQKILDTMNCEIYSLEYSTHDFDMARNLISNEISDEYNKGYADAMVRKASCCETNERLVKLMAEALDSQLKWRLNQKNDDGSEPDIFDEDSWSDTSHIELREILVDLFTTAKEALAEYRKVIKS